MRPKDESTPKNSDRETLTARYALRLGDGLEYAEFEPASWCITVYHVMGVSRQVSLGYAEVYLLSYFVQHPGCIISRQELLDHAWGDRVVSQGSLNQAISSLRGVLGDDQKSKIILTIPRRGYQFNDAALMDLADWLVLKDKIIRSEKMEQKPLPSQRPEAAGMPYSSRWSTFIPWLLVLALGTSLLASFLEHYYSAFPPYASVQLDSAHTKVTLVAENSTLLEATSSALNPILERLDALGGGRVLINRVRNYLEVNCLKPSGKLFTLRVQVDRLPLLEDSYLQRCLK